MLSKYECFKKGCTFDAEDSRQGRMLEAALCADLKKRYSQVMIRRMLSGGGTLGIFFELHVDGRIKFAKTHPAGKEYQENLIKEIEIMSLLYHDILEIEKVILTAEGKQYVFMIMDQLFPCGCQPSPRDLREWIRFYQQRLSGADLKVNYTFAQILASGKESLEALHAKEFLSKELYFQCIESLYRIEDKNMTDFEFLCHGDLSNVNIMQDKNGRKLIIDWEDALAAFPEYDYLYWLTFFSQRKYYGMSLFRDWDIEHIWGIDLMVLITIIKCEMSVWNRSYVNHRMSFQDRIYEIYEMAVV